MLSVANQPIMVSVFMPSVVILNVVAPSTLDEYPYAECRGTQHDIEWHFSECRYTESRSTFVFSQLLTKVIISKQNTRWQ
jgi:hypothetical protein